MSSAHEIRPAVADVRIEGDQLTMEVTLALESLVAGLDLQGLEDTNDSPQAEDYDRLRAEAPAALEAELRRLWDDQISPGFIFQPGDARVLSQIETVTIPEVGNVELPRDSVLTLSVDLPPDGSAVTVGWVAAYGPLILRHVDAGEEAFAGFLGEGALSPPLPRAGGDAESAGATFVRYIILGFEHIIPKGLDHILFVLGLFFFSIRMGPLLWQVTAFTAAHTVTLGMASVGIVTVPASIVEPLIAASIVYVAVENTLMRGDEGRISPWRPAVVFAFGLLHGLGFASVLGEFVFNLFLFGFEEASFGDEKRTIGCDGE